jgi:hypothetical protein
MEAEQQQQDTLTFQPQVNPKSAKIATVKRAQEAGMDEGAMGNGGGQDVVERLYRDAANRIGKVAS